MRITQLSLPKIASIAVALTFSAGFVTLAQANCSDPASSPEWHEPMVTVPIAPAAERSVRLGFWNSVGYEQSDWWIAWVPEQGYFEINPEKYEAARPERYWQVADRSYPDVVVREDGTQLAEKHF